MRLPLVELEGTPRVMGEQFGEAARGETHELFDRRLRAAMEFARVYARRDVVADQVLAVARRSLPIAERYDPTGYQEFMGIARGAAMSPERLYLTQGLTDLRDVLAFGGPADAEGCSSFIATGERTAAGQPLLGQTWDLLTDNMPYVRLVHRTPTDGAPQTWSLTLTGCLSLIGINSEGLAVGTTNLRTTDARPGVQYLSILHRALRSRTFGEAMSAVRDAPRAAGHYYYLADADGNAAGLECSAERCVAFSPQKGLLIRCNHALAGEIAARQAPVLTDSTACRHDRLTHLLESHAAPLDAADVRRFFADHEGDDEALCRHHTPPVGISTNACVIMSPETREIHACRGQAHVGDWRTATC